jgi:predicted nucleotidyltransferase component of viral defense system
MASAELGSRMVFKGGTSLSKVFGLIDRFSEDIDLVHVRTSVSQVSAGARRIGSPLVECVREHAGS